MKYTKEQLEKIDFGKFKYSDYSVERAGSVLLLFNSLGCVALKIRSGWSYYQMYCNEVNEAVDAANNVEAFIKSELERIEKLREPPEGYELCKWEEAEMAKSPDGLWYPLFQPAYSKILLFCRKKKEEFTARTGDVIVCKFGDVQFGATIDWIRKP